MLKMYIQLVLAKPIVIFYTKVDLVASVEFTFNHESYFCKVTVATARTMHFLTPALTLLLPRKLAIEEMMRHFSK